MSIMPIKPKRRILFHTKDLVSERDTLRTRCEELEKENSQLDQGAVWFADRLAEALEVVEKAREVLEMTNVPQASLEPLREALAKLDKPTEIKFTKISEEEAQRRLMKAGQKVAEAREYLDKPTCDKCGGSGKIQTYNVAYDDFDIAKCDCQDCRGTI